MPDKIQARKILILAWPETSAYNATFLLARVLSQKGYTVVYALPAVWQEHVSSHGFRTVEIDIHNFRQARTHNWLRRLFTSRAEAERQIASLCESLGWIKSEGFSLVLLYTTLWQYAPVLRRMDIPFVSINPSLASAWSLEIPPIFSSLHPIPEHQGFNHARNVLAWLALLFFGAFNHRYRGVIQASPEGLPARKKDLGIAARHFYFTLTEPLRHPVYYQWLRIARREGILVRWGDYGHRLTGPEIILGPEVLDFPRRGQRNTRLYAGACVDTQLSEEAFDWSLIDPHRPAVYCAIGSHGSYWNQANRRRLVESVLLAFQAHPEWQLLIQVRPSDDQPDLESLPENIHAKTWFPQLQVLQHADLIISHGGFSTVREALFFGVPMIIFPFGVDQPGNAARVCRLQAGLAGNIHTVTAGTISKMVESVFTNPIYRQNALKLSQKLQADKSCADVIAYLNTFIRAEA
jgi:zeaxanthin glucosyltransferase